jgi:hypothetical protein
MRARALLTVAAIAATVLLVPAPAQAAARVSVENDDGAAKVDPTYATTIRVSGSGFQSIKGGHGGIYVFFGTVKGTWQPSKGGQVGTNYSYVPDSESKNNQGYQRFVAFPGSDTAAAANGGTIKTDGTWSTELTVPGATFKTVDRDGDVVTVDCRKVTCGVMTIGAHGVKNAKNETFTPVSFAPLDQSAASTAEETASAPTTAAATPSGAAAAPAAVTPTAAAPVKAADATAAVDTGTAVVGRVLSFTGNGFLPGEQVVATLDDGRAAVGPLSAGPSGEIAGVIQLPRGTTAGTHVLRLMGAASGATPTVNFPIAADPSTTVADADADGLPGWAPFAFVALGIVALLIAATFAALRFRAIRRGRTPSEPATSTGEAAHAI